MLAEFAKGSQDIDIIDLIKLSELRGKDELIDSIQKRRQEAAQAQGGAAQIQAMTAQADISVKAANAQKITQEAIQTRIENQLMLTNPPQKTQLTESA